MLLGDFNQARRCGFQTIFKNLIIHEYHVVDFIRDSILLKISACFYGLDNVDLQNNYAIELMKWVVFEAVLKTRNACSIGSDFLIGYPTFLQPRTQALPLRALCTRLTFLLLFITTFISLIG